MFLYQVKDETIRILGCRSYGGVVEIPEIIDGKAVTELAPYAFSEGWGRREMLAAAGEVLLADSDGQPHPADEAPLTDLPPIVCCGHLKEIILPSTVKKIGNYAFYNCYELQALRCSSTIMDVGCGLFTGCTGVKHLEIHVEKGFRSCFQELISELRQELYVNYYEESDQIRAKLVFPEMYEESVENTPARIIMREMHGCGHRYRYCFDQTVFQFHRYDALFPHIKVQEPERVVTALVTGRLRYPFDLLDQYRVMYEAYLGKHLTGAGAAALESKDTELFCWLSEQYADTREKLDGLIELTNQAGGTDILGYLMDLRHRRFPANKRTFLL